MCKVFEQRLCLETPGSCPGFLSQAPGLPPTGAVSISTLPRLRIRVRGPWLCSGCKVHGRPCKQNQVILISMDHGVIVWSNAHDARKFAWTDSGTRSVLAWTVCGAWSARCRCLPRTVCRSKVQTSWPARAPCSHLLSTDREQQQQHILTPA